jgi:ribonuclease E
VGSGLLEAFSVPCECCNGRGVIVSLEPVDHAPPADHHHGRDGSPRGGSGRGAGGRAGRGSAGGGSSGGGQAGAPADAGETSPAEKSATARPRPPVAANGNGEPSAVGTGPGDVAAAAAGGPGADASAAARAADAGAADAGAAGGGAPGGGPGRRASARAAATDGGAAGTRRASGGRRRRRASDNHGDKAGEARGSEVRGEPSADAQERPAGQPDTGRDHDAGTHPGQADGSPLAGRQAEQLDSPGQTAAQAQAAAG